MDKKHFLPLTATNYGSVEDRWVKEALASQRLEGNGVYTQKVHQYFKQQYGFNHAYFTPSCTDALELAALLLPLQPGDEVIVPSYTFPSSAHAFALRGAKIVLADSEPGHPNLDVQKIKNLINSKTRAVCVVHYGGVACDMPELMQLAALHGFYVVEDAAQAIDAFLFDRPLGAWGDFGAFSFHQTKNISCGEGGLLVVNNKKFIERAEILREKGTNRSAFIRGQVDKYTCVDIGSSYVGSDLNAALLLGQLERMPEMQRRRLQIWDQYHQAFNSLPVLLPKISADCRHNAHNYFLVFDDLKSREAFTEHLKALHIGAVFHYVGLHMGSYYGQNAQKAPSLGNSEKFSNGLVRLPLYSAMSDEDVARVIQGVLSFFKGQK